MQYTYILAVFDPCFFKLVRNPGGEYWRPVFNILEGNFEVLLVNARHMKALPGRKTDIKDALRDCGIAELLQHGLLRPSFIPPIEQRDLRDLTRHRSNFIRERVNFRTYANKNCHCDRNGV